ncbi:MAG: hypothetical protein WBJ33_10185 [Candidatus Nanopelagicales bacterium]
MTEQQNPANDNTEASLSEVEDILDEDLGGVHGGSLPRPYRN